MHDSNSAADDNNAARAAAPSGIGLGTKGNLRLLSSVYGYKYIYFGTIGRKTDDGESNPTPIKWRVLAETNGNGGHLRGQQQLCGR